MRIDDVTIVGVNLTDFTFSSWDKIFDFYPEYFKAVQARGGVPQPIQPYVLEAAKQLELAKVEIDRGPRGVVRTADQWMHFVMEHFGLDWMMRQFNRFSAHSAEIKAMEARGGR